MRLFGRLIWVAFSLMLAAAVATVFLPVAIVADSQLRQMVASMQPDDLRELLLLFIDPHALAVLAVDLAGFLAIMLLAIAVAPVTLVAAIGEAASLRGLAWYAGASGIIAGAMPWIIRSARGVSGGEDIVARNLELRLAAIFLLTGVVAGLVYWAAAGRNAGRSRPE